jgi:hypothetical protein
MKNGTFLLVDHSKRSYKDGQLHSYDDEPAIVFLDGGKHWYKDGVRHRDNELPAEIWGSGSMYYFVNGELHRLTGPAIEHTDPNTNIDGYYVNGIHLTKEEHANHPLVKKYKLQILLDRILREHK